MLKPIHKMAIAGTVVFLAASCLVAAGYAWGSASGRADEKLLSWERSSEALARMKPSSKGDDAEPLAKRISKARYIAWLEERLDEETERVSKLASHRGAGGESVQAVNQRYSELAKLVATAAHSAAQASGGSRETTSRIAVQVLSEFWRDTHGQELTLPEDLFVPSVSASSAAGVATSGARVAVPTASTPTLAASDHGVVVVHTSTDKPARPPSAQVSAIRQALAEFNRASAP